MNYIFIRNKLISCDSILPVALEIHEKTGEKFNFVTWHYPTYIGVQKNIVINDCINKIGELTFVGSRKGNLLDKLVKGLFLLKCAFDVVFNNARLIHFGTLLLGKFSVLTKLAKPHQLYLAQTDSSGYSKMIVDVTKRVKDFDDNTSKEVAPNKGSFISFCDNWPWLKDPRVQDLKVYKIQHPRAREPWKKYIESNYKEYTRDLKLTSNVITIMLGFFGPFGRIRTENSVKECFIETLEVISELNIPDLTVVLKPHIITNIEELDEILANFKNINFQKSYLHPSILARVSDLFICNSYSTSVYDGYIAGTPILEYTDYHPFTMELTNGKSSREEYVNCFINRDKELLKINIEKYITSKELKYKNNINLNECDNLFHSFS